MARTRQTLRTGRVWRGGSRQVLQTSRTFLASRNSAASPPPSPSSASSSPAPPQSSPASPPSSIFNDPAMPCSWEAPLSPIELDDCAGIIPFQDIVPFQGIREEADDVVYPDLFSQLLDDDDNANDRPVMDTLLAAAEVPEYAEATQLSHRKDLSDAAPPVSKQGTQQMLTPKAATISIATSGRSEAGSSSSPIVIGDSKPIIVIDDGDDDDGRIGGGIGGGIGSGIGSGIGGVPIIAGPVRDSTVLAARGKIVAVLKVLATELKEKEEPKSGVKRSFAEFHRDSADSISDLVESFSKRDQGMYYYEPNYSANVFPNVFPIVAKPRDPVT
ncbi:hypothetical protein BKA61DRAFT_656589 [Leptodontidium sp. MPI-SDFR-AT-0119]|nr:hypothetical protein BKA61DRAFT_656589 [Leptodontidium sp. MPI-SDFR-AT-0119]